MTDSINADIKDAIRFAQAMGVKDAIFVFLTPAMLQEVCKDAGIAYAPNAVRRMHVGRYTFIERDGLEKALVLQTDQLPGEIQ